jgi:hypothetical protein
MSNIFDRTQAMKEPTVTIPLSDYKALLELVELDDMMITCEVCGAWLHRDDPACATTDCFNGCWKVAGRPKDAHLCRSYRATVMEQPSADEAAGRS